MADPLWDIGSYTGSDFEKFLVRKVKDEKNWKGGKINEFVAKPKGIKIILFHIKAMKRQNPIEDLMTFYEDGTEALRWEDAREYMEQSDFAEYYRSYLNNRINTFMADFESRKQELEICFMLTFEIARCTIASSEEVRKGINVALDSEHQQDLIDLCKIFPKKERTRIEEDRRKNALSCINRRKKMEHINEISQIWPRGEDPEAVLEIFSDNPIKRKYAFATFLERKKKYEDLLLSQEVQILEYFKTILTTDDVNDATRAFDLIDKNLRKKNGEDIISSHNHVDDEEVSD